MMHNKTWTLDHYGHVVRDLDGAIRAYQQNFGFTVDFRETMTESKVELVFLRLENCLIELLAPLEGNTSLVKFLETRGEALHHVCFRVESIERELARLSSSGTLLIDKTPRRGAKNSLIAFIHPSETSGVLVELCEHRV